VSDRIQRSCIATISAGEIVASVTKYVTASSDGIPDWSIKAS
jgi:hypothetical protein